MRRPAFKPSTLAPAYLPAWPLPPAEELRRFARACHKLADQESDTDRRLLFRQMEAAWTALAGQVERTDDLLLKLHAIRRHSLN